MNTAKISRNCLIIEAYNLEKPVIFAVNPIYVKNLLGKI